MNPTFTKYARLESGNECSGSDIQMGGKDLGQICRIVEWRDVGSVSVSYKGTVTGYRVALRHEEEEPTFKTLTEARAYARKHAQACFDQILANGWK